ncbi:MAG: ABC transporter permease [Panacagrimonas sp.]
MNPDQVGFLTLLKKEFMRFWSVFAQTVMAPVITALLYLFVFAQALQGRTSAYEGISYTEFLLPGLIMMTVLQNAFANTSSSLIQSKVMGNLVFILMSPLGALEWFGAYVLAALARTTAVTAVMLAATYPFVPLPLHSVMSLLAMFFLASASLAVLGIIAGIVSQKFDHIAAFTNFFIMPLSFLSGVFYSVHALPEFWLKASHLNPFFYLIDGFRYGFFGESDVAIGLSLLWGACFFLILSAICLWMLATGYRLRH